MHLLDLDESVLGKQISLLSGLDKELSAAESAHRNRAAAIESEVAEIDMKKSELRDEIRDLEGFAAMSKRLSGLADAGGATIMATAAGSRRKSRR